MVKVSYQQKPYRRALMETYRRDLHRQPERRDQCRPRHPGRSIRTRPAASASPSRRRSRSPPQNADTNYSLGSVLNHVLLHQTVIGIEAIEQMEMAGYWPDVVIGCAGGGSNFAGLAFPFLGKKLREGKKRRASSPSSRRPARR